MSSISASNNSGPGWQNRHERAKRDVGMAEPGTWQYDANAAYVLGQHAGPNMWPETRAKLEALANSPSPLARQIAEEALNGHRPEYGEYFNIDDNDDDDDYDDDDGDDTSSEDDDNNYYTSSDSYDDD